MIRRINPIALGIVLVGVSSLVLIPETFGRGPGGSGRGGGGSRGSAAARPSMGVGGGGRPGGGVSRPSPSISRPSVSRPSGGASRPNISTPSSRPSLPSVSSRPSPRPSPSPSVSRPSLGVSSKPNVNLGSRPDISRPSVSRPSVSPPPVASRPGISPGISNRPSLGNIDPGFSRPRPGDLAADFTRPSPGGNRPSVGRPEIGKPGLGTLDRPPFGGGDRPSVGKPGVGRPDRPDLGSKIERPSTLPGNRPSLGKPEIGDRPGIKDRPGMDRPVPKQLPGDRPGIKDRPGIDRPLPKQLPGDRPIIGDRPGMDRPRPKQLPGDRPIIGGKPGIGDRPIVGGRPGPGDRPIIGGGSNIGNKIGSGNVGNWVGNDFHFNFNNVNRPGWGYGGGDRRYHWNDHWYDRHIHYHHHGWYHGCWSGHWGSTWYVPVAVGATYWGLSALTRSWGYGYYYGYVNPYYTTTVVATAPAYDYSQPIVINNYVESGDPNVAAYAPSAAPAEQAPAPAESADEQAGYNLLDKARDAFQRNDYKSALNLTRQAVQKVPSDPVIHEFGALCLFALGEYQEAAAVLNALLAVAPGMDWTTLISLYSNADEYTAQLRALEAHCKQKPEDSAAAFVLAYHYLVCGHAESAKNALQRVVAAQPNDQVAKRMYDAVKGDDELPVPPGAQTETPAAKPAAEPEPEAPKTDAAAPTTDLVGQWRAERDGDVFDLTIDDQGQFIWKATPKGKEPTSISGAYGVTGSVLVMDSADQGTMAGRVTSGGPDQFQFVIAGGPPGDTGLTFQRVKPQP